MGVLSVRVSQKKSYIHFLLQISVLIPLLEKRELLIPGRGDCLKVASGFQFFATRR